MVNFKWEDTEGISHELEFRKLSSEEGDAAKYEYTRAYNEALSEGILPRTALRNRLADAGIDLVSMEEECEKMQAELNITLDELRLAREKREKFKIMDLKLTASRKRDSLLSKRTEVRDFLSACAENIAEDIRDVFIMATILMENGAQLIESDFKDTKKAMKDRNAKYRKDRYSRLRGTADYHFVLQSYGLDPDFASKYPEKQEDDFSEKVEESAKVVAATANEEKAEETTAEKSV